MNDQWIVIEKIKMSEENSKMKGLLDIVRVLSDAGYHRAKSPDIDSFSKIVGGLCWAICASGFRVKEASLVFEQHAPVGLQIRLCENVVNSLRQMNCPYQLQAHQIQRGDWSSLLPVIKWVVDYVSTVGKERESISQDGGDIYYKKISNASEAEQKEANTLTSRVSKRYRFSTRRYRLGADAESRIDSPEAMIQATLLEFGHQPGKNHVQYRRDILQDESLAKEYGNVLEKAEKDDEARIQRTKALNQELMKSREKIPETRPRRKSTSIGFHTMAKKDSQVSQLEGKLKTERAKIEKAHKKLAKLEVESQQVSDQEGLVRLRGLVEQVKIAQEKEKEFRTECKVKVAALQNELKQLEETNVAEKSKGSEVEENVLKKHQALKETLVKKNKYVAKLSRQIDDVSTRVELVQYERRFIELYDELATKLVEQRRHITTYNMLETTQELMEKEHSLLQSVEENFNLASRSDQGREQLLHQLDHVLAGLRARLSQIQTKFARSKEELDLKSAEYHKLLGSQREYFRAVKDFQNECDRHDVLVASYE